MRHIGILNKEWSQIFQSTHPLRDATPLISFDIAVFNDFNPRTPYGMRPHGNGHCLVFFLISIHAPLTGCDKNVRKNRQSEKNFNPRTPYGMRHNYIFEKINERYFNPRTPYGMRHFEGDILTLVIVISIHAPLTGCDLERLLKPIWMNDFNPRTPYGMRQSWRN